MDRYCVLGLLHKLSDDRVPAALLERARRHQRERRHSFRVQFYAVPAYSTEVLAEADRRAGLLLAAGVSVRGLCHESVSVVLGAETAGAVYPQVGRREPSESARAFAGAVERVLLAEIDRKGYCTTAEIRSALSGHHEWRSLTDRRIDKCLPDVLIRHTLAKVYCGRAIKERLGIVRRGYPRVIVRASTRRGAEGRATRGEV